MIPYSDDRIFNGFAIRAVAHDLLLNVKHNDPEYSPYNFDAVYPSYKKGEATTKDFPALAKVIKEAYDSYDYSESIYNHLLKWFSRCDLSSLNSMLCCNEFLRKNA